MSNISQAFVIAATAAACACAQPAETLLQSSPFLSPTVVAEPAPESIPVKVANPGALTASEKARLAFRNTFGPKAIGNRLFSAGLDQISGDPEEWGGGMDSFGQRFASRMGILATRNSIRLATDVAFKIDPRYDRCKCEGFLSRTGHAWKRVVVSLSDAGTEMPAYSNFAAAYATPWVTHTWYPDRLNTTSRKIDNGAVYLGWRGVSNMVREFWPDIKRGLRRGDN